MQRPVRHGWPIQRAPILSTAHGHLVLTLGGGRVDLQVRLPPDAVDKRSFVGMVRLVRGKARVARFRRARPRLRRG
jgi:hypothetical protein